MKENDFALKVHTLFDAQNKLNSLQSEKGIMLYNLSHKENFTADELPYFERINGLSEAISSLQTECTETQRAIAAEVPAEVIALMQTGKFLVVMHNGQQMALEARKPTGGIEDSLFIFFVRPLH